jgi:hypothetical protein
MKALKTTVAIVLFTPGSFVALYCVWSYAPGMVIGAGLTLLAWLGVALLRGE